MSNQWLVNEKNEYVISARTEADYWRIRIKWDGCMDWEHSMNDPIEDAKADDVDRMHVCSLSTLAELVADAALMIKTQWTRNDAVEDAEAALAIMKKAANSQEVSTKTEAQP